MIDAVKSKVPASGARDAMLQGSPAAQASSLPVLGSDVFVRASGSEGEPQKIAGLLSEVSLELRGMRMADWPEGRTLPVSGGLLALQPAMPGPGSSPRELSRVDLRLNSGSYSVDFSVDQNGGLRIRKLYIDGRSVTSQLRDALKEQIMADPALWGSLTVLAAGGAAALAHEYARTTGDRVRFDLVNTRVWEDGPWSMRMKADAEFTGDHKVVRGSGVGTSVVFKEERLRAELGVNYRREQKWEAEASASYALSKDIDVRASARYRPDGYEAGIFLEARF